MYDFTRNVDFYSTQNIQGNLQREGMKMLYLLMWQNVIRSRMLIPFKREIHTSVMKDNAFCFFYLTIMEQPRIAKCTSRFYTMIFVLGLKQLQINISFFTLDIVPLQITSTDIDISDIQATNSISFKMTTPASIITWCLLCTPWYILFFQPVFSENGLYCIY